MFDIIDVQLGCRFVVVVLKTLGFGVILILGVFAQSSDLGVELQLFEDFFFCHGTSSFKIFQCLSAL